MKRDYDVIVIGAGIVGLAFARSSALRGKRVLLLERDEFAKGATVRNFGLVWPIGQPLGARFNRAKVSAQIWDEFGAQGLLEVRSTGSLHLARSPLECQVLQEFATLHGDLVEMVTPEEARALSPAVRAEGLLGGLFSPHERMVNPRLAAAALANWLKTEAGVECRFGATVVGVETGQILLSDGERYSAPQIFVCSGPDLRTLFPAALAQAGVTLCKLQMMRTAPQPLTWQLGPALCAGLTLGHYEGFEVCPSLPALRQEFAERYPDQLRLGIHVLVSQQGDGGVILGDTHAYGPTHTPFQDTAADEHVLNYLAEFADLPCLQIAERWVGVYPRLRGCSELILDPLPGVTLVNALGGAGMTMSFGLAEEVVADRLT